MRTIDAMKNLPAMMGDLLMFTLKRSCQNFLMKPAKQIEWNIEVAY